MKDNFPLLNFGLYRDDGLACHRRIPGPTLDRYRKDIEKLFNNNGLKITIDTGLKSADFLDVTFNLTEEIYKPYKKPNNQLLYVNSQSNHPKSVLKHIPNSVEHRLNAISSNENVFNAAKTEYERALQSAGYNNELEYKEPSETTTPNRKKKNRKRKIIWYNPPYNQSLRTKFGKQFLKLLNKHFPKGHKLHQIINKNNVKLSYSTTKNIKRILQNHNSKILKKNDERNEKTCSCPSTKKSTCPLDNQCLSKCIVYKATVEKTGHFYIGITENDFKKRLTRHKHSFRHEADKNSTTLSTHVWNVGEAPNPKIKWEILKKAQPRRPGAKECQLCLEEKIEILKASKNPLSLNRRSELAQRCVTFHRAKHKLLNIK